METALVLPFFLFVLCAVLLISQFLMTEDRIHGALVETGRVLAGEKEETITLARAQLEFRKQVKSRNLNMVSGGVSGISLFSSKLPNSQQEIELHAEYRMKVTIPFLFTISIPVKVTVVQRVFDGCHVADTSEGEGGDFVYVAEYESVYHTSPQCTHIAIQLVSVKDASSLAGKRQCEFCKNYHEAGEYVTLTGDCIHRNPQCSRIKRTVYMIEKDKVGSLPLCSRCAKNK